MKLSRWTIALYVGLVFASGVVVGAFGHRFTDVSAVSANARRNPEEFRKRFTAEMLNEVLESTRAEFRTTRDSIEPALGKIRDEQHQRILAILNAGQQAEYEKMRQEREAHAKQSGAGLPSR